MGFQTFSILTEGVWASVTGGWYYDKKQSHFSNIFHLYIWLIFLCFPLVNSLFLNTYLSWFIYCMFICSTFIIVKLVNAYFHCVFDTGKCIKDDVAASDPALNSATCNEIENEENKDAFEMVVISNSQNNNLLNDNSSKFSNTSTHEDFLKHIQTAVDQEENCQDNIEKQIASKTIDFKADVHFNDTDTSCGNLSMLFKTENEFSKDEEEEEGEEDKNNASANESTTSVKNNRSFDVVSNQNTSLSNINTPYTNANLSNNSISVIDTHNCEKVTTFRRARSELEAIKHCDKYSKRVLVPPSHPVSMDVINSKSYMKNNEESTPLDLSRFNNSNTKLDQFDVSRDYQFKVQSEIVGQTSKDSLAEENSANINLEKIEENLEKIGSTYIVDFDSSEDGDESELSLCTNGSAKQKAVPISSRKLSKQPFRKPRFSNPRKRTPKPPNRTVYSDCLYKQPQETELRSRHKPGSIVLLSTSDEEDEDKTDVNSPLRGPYDRFNSSSDSSLMPSSSSSSLDKKESKADNYVDNYAPSTSTGISRSNGSRKKQRNKLTHKIPRNCLSENVRMIDAELAAKLDQSHPLVFRNPTYFQNIHSILKTDSDKFSEAFFPDLIRKNNINPELLKCISSNMLLEKSSRSNSIRDASSSKNSIALPSSNLIAEILSAPGTHIAASHEDTSVGAVHIFQDERGNWFSYTFDENSTGLAKGLCALNPFTKLNDGEKFKSNALVPSNSIFYLNNCVNSTDQNMLLFNNDNNNALPKEVTKLDNIVSLGGNSSHTPDSLNSNTRNLCFDSMPLFDNNFDPVRAFLFDVSTASDFINSFNNHSFSHSYQRSQQQLKQSQYYEVNIMNLTTVKIRFDRLSLLAFLDRNLTVSELILSILLAILVAILSSVLLYNKFFHDLSLVLFCLVVASSQYTLLKSVQPDAASPTHGFNQITIYSRPIYFCLTSLIVLVSHEYVNANYSKNISFEVYGVDILSRDVVSSIHYFSRSFLLAFPLLFTLGFLPQINTFVIYVLEQIDIHIFGGTASTMGMISSIYSILRSTLACCLLYLLAHVLNIKDTQKATFSVFCGILIALSYHLSRLPSDPSLYWKVVSTFFTKIKDFLKNLSSSKSSNSKTEEDSQNQWSIEDPLPEKLRHVTLSRLESDFIICIFIAISVFSVHVSSIFKLQPYMNLYTTIISIHWGFILHYIVRHCRKQLPWLCFSNPILKSDEYKRFEVKGPARNMWFEKIQAWFWLLEKNVVYLLVFLSYITTDCPLLINNYGPNLGIFLLVLFGFKCFRSTFNDPSNNYIILMFTHLFFNYDFKLINGNGDNIFLLNYFIVSIVYYKISDFLLKLRFVITYVAPWQITWGSAFHAFAQPFSVPHSAMLLVQIFVSSVLSSPLQPILGSAIFFASYVRPIKFWERDYNTKRVDHSNTRLASQIDKAQIGSDDNNLNSIFYEHLTRSLQHSLYGDLVLGRWGDVTQGDCFVLASDYLNCLVHIIELGNGFVTFQVRGLEFRGTYCQQREVEAITENVSEDEGCCCCESGHFNGVLSVNAAFNQRWLSWEVTHTNYVLEGYSISENSASTILQPYDLRKALITYYVKSIIYYCINYKSFFKWIEDEELRESLNYLLEPNFVDLDPTFNLNIDEDYDHVSSGITLTCFKSVYMGWILFCIDQVVDSSKHEFVRKNEDFIISLCFGLSLLARRALGTASHHNSALISVDFFLYGFHALFKGDFRVHSARDEWVFQDMDFLNKVIAPSVRMSLKLHQDQFTTYEEYESSRMLFDAIAYYQKSIVISHEADPIWRSAILSNVPSLLALRHVFEEGTDQYKVIMLNKRYLSFRVIKINRECVRGLWAGQQQELIFLRNRNPERGSIQNAKQVLRNIINSSCDQPIGYPIYVSPLTTSYAETSSPLNQIIGPPLSLMMFKNFVCGFFQKIRNRCSEVCSSSGTNDLTFNVRLSKSESSDRGVDDNICSKGSMMSTHSQITQMSNYNRYLRKKAIQEKNEEENSLHNSTLVNLTSNRNVISLLANSINAQEANLPTTNINKSTAETSFINSDSTTRSLIIEKSAPHSKGEAV